MEQGAIGTCLIALVLGDFQHDGRSVAASEGDAARWRIEHRTVESQVPPGGERPEIVVLHRRASRGRHGGAVIMVNDQ
jgi:hypothetical protein